eukprot:2782209-Rhodomonas_salina.2
MQDAIKLNAQDLPPPSSLEGCPDEVSRRAVRAALCACRYAGKEEETREEQASKAEVCWGARSCVQWERSACRAGCGRVVWPRVALKMVPDMRQHAVARGRCQCAHASVHCFRVSKAYNRLITLLLQEHPGPSPFCLHAGYSMSGACPALTRGMEVPGLRPTATDTLDAITEIEHKAGSVDYASPRVPW